MLQPSSSLMCRSRCTHPYCELVAFPPRHSFWLALPARDHACAFPARETVSTMGQLEHNSTGGSAIWQRVPQRKAQSICMRVKVCLMKDMRVGQRKSLHCAMMEQKAIVRTCAVIVLLLCTNPSHLSGSSRIPFVGMFDVAPAALLHVRPALPHEAVQPVSTMTFCMKFECHEQASK